MISKMSVKAKLLLAFTIVAAAGGAQGWFAMNQMGQIQDSMGNLYNRELVGLSNIKEANTSLIKIGRAVRNSIIETDMDKLKEVSASYDAIVAGFQEQFASASEQFYTEKGRQTISSVERIIPEYLTATRTVIDLALQNKNEEAAAGVAKMRGLADQLDNVFTELSETKTAVAEQSFQASQALYQRASMLVIGVIIATVAAALALGWYIARWIATALLEVDQIAQIVLVASQQLSGAAEDLSAGAQESASSLEETASSLEEITATVRQNADNADEANQVSNASRQTAEKGGQVVGECVTAMSEINHASKKIAAIITTIDEIAFQTNLLALNAAVEAARAGEQGRGFAVVAGEVRNLAQRSAASAKEIKDLIQDSVGKVEKGTDLVNKSGSTLEEIVNSVKKVTDIVGEIAAASREQSTGIEQVNVAVTQLDQVTQTNAAQTEELSATSVSLTDQAETLQRVVAQFNLTNDSHHQAVKPSRTGASRIKAAHVAPRSSKPSAPARTAKPTKSSKPAPTPSYDEEPVLVGAGADGGFEEF
ncbi:Methyl-accepting chemotaxis protein II [Planctomycetes bacterium K2D]|nr:Methyl-accepting chemotaxis protein II [Planctomycetes bacterium K2D]